MPLTKMPEPIATEHPDRTLLPLGDSVLSSWIRSICQTARGYGVTPELILKRIGMDVSLLTVPDARYSALQVRRFWEMLISATGDELIGMRCGHEMQVATLHGLGLAIVTSHSLAQVLDLLARYGKIISTTMGIEVQHRADSSTLYLQTHHGIEPKRAALMCMLSFIERQACSLAQHHVSPLEVRFYYPNVSLGNRLRLEKHFGCPVITDRPGPDSITFSYEDVIEPYAGANANLRDVNEQAAMHYLNLVHQFSFSIRVEEEIQKLFAEGKTIKISEVAQSINLSARTLQRRLEAEGTSFSQLQDTCPNRR